MVIYTEKCTGCKACGFACEKNAITFEDFDDRLLITLDDSLCKNGCTKCKEACLFNAVDLSSFVFNQSTYEIPYLECKSCNKTLKDTNDKNLCTRCRRKLATRKIYKNVRY